MLLGFSIDKNIMFAPAQCVKEILFFLVNVQLRQITQ